MQGAGGRGQDGQAGGEGMRKIAQEGSQEGGAGGERGGVGCADQ